MQKIEYMRNSCMKYMGAQFLSCKKNHVGELSRMQDTQNQEKLKTKKVYGSIRVDCCLSSRDRRVAHFLQNLHIFTDSLVYAFARSFLQARNFGPFLLSALLIYNYYPSYYLKIGYLNDYLRYIEDSIRLRHV